VARRIGNLAQGDLLARVIALEERVAALERKTAGQTFTLAPDGVTLDQNATSYVRLLWAEISRSGSHLRVGVAPVFSGASSMSVQLRAAGAEIAEDTVSTSGQRITLAGFVPEQNWPFGATAVIEVYGRLNGPSQGATGTLASFGGALT